MVRFYLFDLLFNSIIQQLSKIAIHRIQHADRPDVWKICHQSWLGPSVFNPYIKVKTETPIFFSDASACSDAYLKPRPLFLSHNLNTGSRLPESRKDEADRSNPENKAGNSSVAHDPSEPGHRLLRVKVAFGTIVILGALYFLMNTVPKGHTFERQTIFVYTILGILNVCLGAVLIAQAFLG